MTEEEKVEVGRRRPMQLRWLKVAIVTLIIVAFFPLVRVAGPMLEASWFPVFKADVVDAQEVGGRFRFSLAGVKYQSCLRSSYNIFWVVGGVYMPTGLTDGEGKPVRLPIIPKGQNFFVGPYYVPIGQTLRLNKEVKLVLSFVYQCHPLWPTEQQIVFRAVLAESSSLLRRRPLIARD